MNKTQDVEEVQLEPQQSRSRGRTVGALLAAFTVVIAVAIAIAVQSSSDHSGSRASSGRHLRTAAAAAASVATPPMAVAPGVTLSSLPGGASARSLSDRRESFVTKGMANIEVALADGGQVRLVIQKTADANADLNVYQDTFKATSGTISGFPSVSGFSMSPGWQTIAWAPSATVQVALHYTGTDATTVSQIANGVSIDEGQLP